MPNWRQESRFGREGTTEEQKWLLEVWKPDMCQSECATLNLYLLSTRFLNFIITINLVHKARE